MNSLLINIKAKIFERDHFACQKCGFQDKSYKQLEIHHIKPKILEGNNDISNLVTLCTICHHFAPDSEDLFRDYIQEKVDWKLLETFRKSKFSTSDRTKFGMERKAKEGGFITRAPTGYNLVNKELTPDEEESKLVKAIFEDFLNNPISLTQLAKKYGFTTSGLKKLLQNKTYIGITKFAEKENQGTHKPIIEKILFDQVQSKLSNI